MVPETGDLAVNGLRIRHYDWGGIGDPIVLLHATGFHGRVYRPVTCGATISVATATAKRLTSSNNTTGRSPRSFLSMSR